MALLRRILVVLVLVFMVKLASGQILIALLFGDKLNSEKVEFGLNVGLNGSSLDYFQDHYRFGANFGLYFNLKIKEKIWFSPSIMMLYPAGGARLSPYPTGDTILDQSLNEATVRRDLRYLSVPLLFRAYYYKGFYAELGPQFMLLTSATDHFEQSGEIGKLQFDRDIIDSMNRFDGGICIGLGYKVPRKDGMTFGGHFYYGASNIYKDSSFADHRNTLFSFHLGIPIGAKHKEDKKD
ncbi:PorT family protein [bacterium SCSIO 12741]|nr:PorT family protein [bacterium SCSIO 12741]